MILWEQFDRNEWYILTMLVISYGAVILLPKRVSPKLMILGLVWGFASSTLFDFTIGGGLLDFYMVNDSNRYELTDLLVYFLFAPFGYFFIYFYEAWKIGKKTLLYYIAGWTAVGAVMQWVSEWMRLTEYQRGYKLEYNIVVFLIVQTITGLFYAHIKSRSASGERGSHMG
ncbi:hypothetical protein [Paenibacillus soyae]|uniref:Uncharacterized protein n=1 Tax=Paenibacillus soyae TaxID=2969249 RepID=A0A9X2MPA9_9BACL|nr:hypothetical protein [Paenibacillus soyae]MCR2803980.1 hypothetical protein [Paenibacillus soyae]